MLLKKFIKQGIIYNVVNWKSGEQMEEIRLQKYLALCNVASRRASEELILQGRVSVNGSVVTELGTKVKDSDKVTVDGKAVKQKKKNVYIMLNKPRGCVTTVSDEKGRATVMEYVSDINERIYHVGRLDFHTEGLLILTNDGDFTYALTHPKHEKEKVYEALVSGIMLHGATDKLQRGVYIDGKKTAPAKVEVKEHRRNTTVVEITIHEGRNRQVRKMCEAVGHEVLALKRTSISGVELGKLDEGKWRHLTEVEINKLKR